MTLQSPRDVDTGTPDRDAHLRSPDFLDVERYPEMRFASTAVEQLDDDVYRVTGDLTIKDVTRPVAVDFTPLTGSAAGPLRQHPGRASRARLAIKQQASEDLTWNAVLDNRRGAG